MIAAHSPRQPFGVSYMRIKLKPNPKEGDTRIISWFAILPVTIGLDFRWLERVTVKQIFRQRWYKSCNVLDWCDVAFCDSKDTNGVK